MQGMVCRENWDLLLHLSRRHWGDHLVKLWHHLVLCRDPSRSCSTSWQVKPETDRVHHPLRVAHISTIALGCGCVFNLLGKGSGGVNIRSFHLAIHALNSSHQEPVWGSFQTPFHLYFQRPDVDRSENLKDPPLAGPGSHMLYSRRGHVGTWGHGYNVSSDLVSSNLLKVWVFPSSMHDDCESVSKGSFEEGWGVCCGVPGTSSQRLASAQLLGSWIKNWLRPSWETDHDFLLEWLPSAAWSFLIYLVI